MAFGTTMITLRGKIVCGCGNAHKYLPDQLPKLAKTIPEISDCHPGTINIQLEAPLKIERPDYEKTIEWNHPACGPMPEIFRLTLISFRFLPPALQSSELSLKGWVYAPDKSPIPYPQRQIEIITRKVEGIEKGWDCEIDINREHKMEGEMTIII